MGARSVVKDVGEFLVELVGEAVAEVVLSLLACALLGLLALTVYMSWSFSPRATLAGVGLLSLAVAHGAWRTFRAPAKGRRRRGLAAVTTVVFTATAATAVFLVFYATGCGCF
ncbi:lysine transporter LysE [Streptomyces erythrochromogenes]|uniref:lysine transporter LysE n=1 Tax=Streptomyces erythrochromogenes TaxID=285574 RepID=UPI0036FDBCF2